MSRNIYNTNFDVVENSINANIKSSKIYRFFYEMTIPALTKNYLYAKTSSTKQLGIIYRQIIVEGSPCKFKEWGGDITLTSPGTPIPIYNYNGINPVPSGAIVEHSATVDYSNATLNDVVYALATEGQGNSAGNSASAGNQLLTLYPSDISFVLELENFGNSTASALIKYVWSEDDSE